MLNIADEGKAEDRGRVELEKRKKGCGREKKEHRR